MRQEHLYLIVSIPLIIFPFLLSITPVIKNKFVFQVLGVLSGIIGMLLIGIAIFNVFILESFCNNDDDIEDSNIKLFK